MKKIKDLIKANPWFSFFVLIQMGILIWAVVTNKFIPPVIIDEMDANRLKDIQVFPNLENPWFRWDSVWYVRIAKDSFFSVDGRMAYAPMYPFIVGLVGRVIGGNYLLAGLLVSSVSLIGACFLLFAEFQQFADKATADRAVRYFLHFPSVFFLFGAYSESLFILLLVLTWRAARKEDWLQTGIWGSFAILTRFVFIIIALPLALLWFQTKGKHKIQALFSLSLIPISFLGWNLFAKWQYGRFFWEETSRFWNSHNSWSIAGVWNNFKEIFLPGLQLATVYLNLFVALLFIILTIMAFRRFPAEYGLLMVGLLVIPLFRVKSTGLLQSVSRYVLSIFPGYLILAEWGNNRWFHRIWTVVSITLLLLLSSIFFMGGWIA